jgi:hypothetical protein
MLNVHFFLTLLFFGKGKTSPTILLSLMGLVYQHEIDEWIRSIGGIDRKLVAVPLRQSQIVRGLPSNQVLLQLQCKTYFSSAGAGRNLWKVNNPPTRLPACHNPGHLHTSIVKTSNLASKTNHYTRIRTAHPSIPIPIAIHRSVITRQYLRALFQTREPWYRSQ